MANTIGVYLVNVLPNPCVNLLKCWVCACCACQWSVKCEPPMILCRLHVKPVRNMCCPIEAPFMGSAVRNPWILRREPDGTMTCPVQKTKPEVPWQTRWLPTPSYLHTNQTPYKLGHLLSLFYENWYEVAKWLAQSNSTHRKYPQNKMAADSILTSPKHVRTFVILSRFWLNLMWRCRMIDLPKLLSPKLQNRKYHNKTRWAMTKSLTIN